MWIFFLKYYRLDVNSIFPHAVTFEYATVLKLLSKLVQKEIYILPTKIELKMSEPAKEKNHLF